MVVSEYNKQWGFNARAPDGLIAPTVGKKLGSDAPAEKWLDSILLNSYI
jgi:hypothetical protein